MIADSERRAIAAKLRAQQAAQFPPPEVAYDVSPALTTWEGIGRIVLDPGTWAECSRLKSRDNRSQTVRSAIAGRLADLIEPTVDRDALLELADEMDESGRHYGEQIENAVTSDIIDDAPGEFSDYARRIREALGVDR